jgi:hypothetical protein
MIEGYWFASHILRRMLPALVFMTVAGLAWLVPLKTEGPHWWTLLGVALGVTIAAWVTVRIFLRAVVVGPALFGFFIVLGLIVITPETAEQWIGAPPVASDLLPSVPIALLRNAALFAAFGSMYFTITSMSDTDHRQRFFAPVIGGIEWTPAFRAVCLAVRHESRLRDVRGAR